MNADLKVVKRAEGRAVDAASPTAAADIACVFKPVLQYSSDDFAAPWDQGFSAVRHPRLKFAPMSPALTNERDVREAYSAHSSELYGFAMRSLGDSGLAEEAVQESFLRAWRAGNKFDARIGSLRTWLFAILRNVVIDLSRARTSRPPVSQGGVEPSVEPLEEAMLSWQIEEAMRRLGEDHRQVLIESYYRGRPYAEVAEKLGVPEGTVKSRVYYGLRALRVVLEEMSFEE